MADLTFNTPAGQTVGRQLMVLYLNTGTYAAPKWHAIGKRVEESRIEMDWGKESKKDILGDTYSLLKKPIKEQSFEPCELDAGDEAQVMLWNLAIKDEDIGKLAALDLLVAHLYAGEADAPFAERYPASTINPSGLGGSGTMEMPIEVTYGGKREIGTVTSTDGTVAFTPAA